MRLAGSMILLVVLAACGAGESAEAPAPAAESTTTASASAAEQTESAAANPCAAVSAQDAGAATGLTLAVHPGDSANDCSYRTADDNTTIVAKVGDTAGYDLMAKMADSEPVTGLGDKAIWSGDSSELFVVKGDRMLNIEYMESAAAEPKTPAAEMKRRSIALAEKLVPTL